MKLFSARKTMLTLSLFALLQAPASVFANDEMLEELKQSLSGFTGVQYTMMGGVVFLNGSTDNISELSSIVNKLMAIEGVEEVRTNIQKKMQ